MICLILDSFATATFRVERGRRATTHSFERGVPWRIAMAGRLCCDQLFCGWLFKGRVTSFMQMVGPSPLAS